MSSSARSDSRGLHRQMRSWRRDRANTTLYEQLSEAYVWVFSIIVIGAMAISALIQTRVNVADECSTAGCADARTSLLWASTLGTVALVAGVAGALGPVLISPAVGSWLLTAPIDRRPILRTRLLIAAVVSAVVGGAIVAVAGLLAGLDPGALTVWASSAAVTAFAMTALAACWQPRSGHRARLIALILGVAAWIWMLMIALDRSPVAGADWLAGGWGIATLIGAIIVAVAAMVWAWRRVAGLRRSDMDSAGGVLASISGALASLDLMLAYDVLMARRWRNVAMVRPVRGGPGGVWALVWRDLIRLRRTPGTVAAFAAAAVVPYLLIALSLEATVIPLSALVAMVLGVWLFPALRTVAGSPGLVRSFPMPLAAVRAATVVVPATLILLWSSAIAPALGHPVDAASDVPLVALATGAAAIGAVIRLLVAGLPNYSSPLVTSPAGAVPPGLLISTLRGFDVLALLTIPLLVAPDANGATVSLLLFGAVTSWLLSRK